MRGDQEDGGEAALCLGLGAKLAPVGAEDGGQHSGAKGAVLGRRGWPPARSPARHGQTERTQLRAGREPNDRDPRFQEPLNAGRAMGVLRPVSNKGVPEWVSGGE